jgi:hypothetical protein
MRMRMGPLVWAGVIALALFTVPHLVLPGLGVVLVYGALVVVAVLAGKVVLGRITNRGRWFR